MGEAALIVLTIIPSMTPCGVHVLIHRYNYLSDADLLEISGQLVTPSWSTHTEN
jgi:hypothetical protein